VRGDSGCFFWSVRALAFELFAFAKSISIDHSQFLTSDYIRCIISDVHARAHVCITPVYTRKPKFACKQQVHRAVRARSRARGARRQTSAVLGAAGRERREAAPQFGPPRQRVEGAGIILAHKHDGFVRGFACGDLQRQRRSGFDCFQSGPSIWVCVYACKCQRRTALVPLNEFILTWCVLFHHFFFITICVCESCICQ